MNKRKAKRLLIHSWRSTGAEDMNNLRLKAVRGA